MYMKIAVFPNIESHSSLCAYAQFVRFTRQFKSFEAANMRDEDYEEQKTGLKLMHFNDNDTVDEPSTWNSDDKMKNWFEYESIFWLIRTDKGFVIYTSANKFYQTKEAPLAPVIAEEIKYEVGVDILSKVKLRKNLGMNFSVCEWMLCCDEGWLPSKVRVTYLKFRKGRINRINLRKISDGSAKVQVMTAGGNTIILGDVINIVRRDDKVIATTIADGPIILG